MANDRARDGEAISNTYALERHGWRGVCIEPFPKNFEKVHIYGRIFWLHGAALRSLAACMGPCAGSAHGSRVLKGLSCARIIRS